MKHAWTVIAAVAFVFAAGVAAGAQAPARDVGATVASTGGMIRGVITAADTGLPIRGAEIRLTGGTQRNQQPFGGMADEAGRYAIAGLPAGQYTVTASKVGYVALAYGQTRVADPGRPVQVGTSDVANIDIALPRGAVIVVRIADESGDPAPGSRVSLFQPRFTDGRRTLTPIATDSLAQTDDRGELRLSGLAPGEYYVATQPLPAPFGARGKEPQTFYPGTASEAEAQPVTVGLGEEIGIGFPLASARGARISGVIEGMVPGRVPLIRMLRRTLGMNAMLPVDASPDGTFRALNLQPAEYVITVTGDTGTGMLRVRVAGEDIDGLVLRIRPQAPLRGRYTFDPKPPAGGPASLGTALRPMMVDGAALMQPVAQVKSDWTFEIPYAMGAGVMRFDEQPRGWFLKAILLDGVDVTDRPMEFSEFEGKPIEVRLTQQATRVTGTVADTRGGRARTYVVVLFPEDAGQWTTYSRGIAAARPDQKGGFLLQGAPPGRYLIAAVEYLEPGQERDPSTLERLRRAATPITLADRESKTVDLKVVAP
jgi:hypothetical protein